MTTTKSKHTRPINWVKAALKDFEAFPEAVRLEALTSLTIAAEGAKADTAKPLAGLGSGVWELAIKARSDAWRVVYAVQIGDAVWVVHAFQKKSKTGIKTPKHEIDVVRERLKRLKELLG
jgi:phage-related protein